MSDATLMRRRDFLASAAGLAGIAALRPFTAAAQTRPLVYADMHSHLGLIGGRASVRDAMVPNGMLVISRKIIADGPVIRRRPGKGVRQGREPAAGELAKRFHAVLARVKGEHKRPGHRRDHGRLDTARTVGLEHVGVGTDLLGLGGSTVMPGYEQFAQLEEILARRGLKTQDIRNFLGGNYLRALRAALTI